MRVHLNACHQSVPLELHKKMLSQSISSPFPGCSHLQSWIAWSTDSEYVNTEGEGLGDRSCVVMPGGQRVDTQRVVPNHSNSCFTLHVNCPVPCTIHDKHWCCFANALASDCQTDITRMAWDHCRAPPPVCLPPCLPYVTRSPRPSPQSSYSVWIAKGSVGTYILVLNYFPITAEMTKLTTLQSVYQLSLQPG